MKSTQLNLKLLLVLLVSLLTSVATPSIKAATITFDGRTQGRLNQGQPNYPNQNQYTLNFYWFTVSAPTTITYSWCVTNGPEGAGTTIDSHIFPDADEFANLDSIAAAVGGLGCTMSVISLDPGQYIFDVSVGSGGYDGGGGLRPLDHADHPFTYYDYHATIVGENIALDEIWKGQANNTFLKTIPEPSGLGYITILVTFALLGRRRLKSFHCLPLVIALLTMVQPGRAQQGDLSWSSIPGMGYGFERSLDLGCTGDWVPLPIATCGSGSGMTQTLFSLETPVVATGPQAIFQRVPMYFFNIAVRPDGSATVWWTDSGCRKCIFERNIAEIAGQPSGKMLELTQFRKDIPFTQSYISNLACCRKAAGSASKRRISKPTHNTEDQCSAPRTGRGLLRLLCWRSPCQVLGVSSSRPLSCSGLSALGLSISNSIQSILIISISKHHQFIQP
jgi:hypothetical protein